MKQLAETNISSICIRTSYDQSAIAWGHEFTMPVFKTLFEGMAKFLGAVKHKGETIGCKISVIEDKNMTEKFIIGAFVESIESDDEDNAFALTVTSKESDMSEIKRENLFSLSDASFRRTMLDLGYNKYCFSVDRINDRSYLPEIYEVVVNALAEYLKANIDIDNEVELKDYFIARIDHGENDTFNISYTPGPILKQHIKDDTVNSIS